MGLLSRLLAKMGVTREVGWTLLTHVLRVATGPLTILLMLRYLTTEVQGYTYAFGGVLAISTFLELGFSQNILQFASHEFSKLTLTNDRQLQGDGVALSRLTSLARLSFKYYGIAAILFAVLASIGGVWFFGTSNDVGVAWQWPWLLACMSSSIALVMNPCWALLEGCNQIAEIGRYRFWSTLSNFALTAIAYVAGLGLYAAPLVTLAVVGGSIIYLAVRWRYFFKNFLLKPALGVISWRYEIWPFQWRIGVSWMSGYLFFSILVPIVFRLSGPVAAGKFGFTMSIVNTIAIASGSWSTTKLAQYGMLVAREEWLELKVIWRKSTMHSLLFAVLGSVVMVISLHLACPFLPMLDERYAGAIIGILLCLRMIIQNFMNSCSYLLRAFKQEPYMWPSVICSIANSAVVWIFTGYWGITGSASGCFLCTVLFFCPVYLIFRKKQLQFMNGVDLIHATKGE